MKVITDFNLIEKALTKAIDKIYPSKDELLKILSSGKKIKIYLGVDPTGPHLHLGHLTNLLTLRRFQELGHEVILLIGDFTAMIGDPTDKLAARQPLSRQQVSENLKTFKKQAAKIIRFSGVNSAKIKFNSKWLAKINFAKLIGLSQNFTVQQMLQRDMFQERLKADKPISLHEFFYPLMQGYDSVALDVDLEIGGTDQTFNMLVGRDLQKIYNHKDKFVITTKLLVNPKTDVKLMNKSEGGLINLDDSPNDIFGKIMALDDAAIMPVAEFSTNMPMDQLEALQRQSSSNPKQAKMAAAKAVIETIYGGKSAQLAEAEFIKVFSEKQKPADIPKLRINSQSLPLADLLVKANLASSKSEARRLIEQGGVKVDDIKKTNPQEVINLAQEKLIQVGPRRFIKVKSS